MALEILQITDAVIRETRLPRWAFRLQAEGESSFDELHGALQRNLRRGHQERMDVIGHDHEFMEKKFLMGAIVRESVDQQFGGCITTEDG